ncbi:hypothetical protein DB345_10015 [Spartobacteria bacterium LR76]|nr:hypothetical protein DB345_10015 [Spartobacteria bacterium LR76]
MKPQTFLPLIAAVSQMAFFATGANAQVFIGFEPNEVATPSPGYTVGNLGTQGGWVSTLNNGSGSGTSTITVSSAQAYAGTQSLLIYDNNTANRPSASYTLASNITAGTFSDAMLQLAGTSDANFYTNFYTTSGTATFSIWYTPAANSGTITLYRGTGGVSLGTYTANLSTTFDSWATLGIVFSESTNTATVLLNGTQIITSSDTTTNWTIGKVEMSVGYSGGTNLGYYFDSVSVVPEPSSLSLVILACGMGLLIIRRHRKWQVARD